MTFEELQSNFPPHSTVPALLRQLFDFEAASDLPYSDFELSVGKYGDAAWFDGDRAAAVQFAVFGKEPDGSLYALWLYPGQRIENAPVVFLGSEGEHCNLVANDLEDFVSLLLYGSGRLGFDAHAGEFEKAETTAARFDEFRSWASKSLGLRPPADPMSLVVRARQAHPDFAAWIECWQREHDAAA